MHATGLALLALALVLQHAHAHAHEVSPSYGVSPLVLDTGVPLLLTVFERIGAGYAYDLPALKQLMGDQELTPSCPASASERRVWVHDNVLEQDEVEAIMQQHYDAGWMSEEAGIFDWMYTVR